MVSTILLTAVLLAQEPEVQPPDAGPPDELRLSYEVEFEMDRFQGIERALVEGLILHQPWLASEQGLTERVRGIGGFTGSDFARWNHYKRRGDVDLLNVRAALLPPERREDLSWLRNWLHGQILISSSLPIQRRDPCFFVDSAMRSIRSLCHPGRTHVLQRMLKASSVLEELSDTFRNARLYILKPIGSWTQLAVERTPALLTFLEEALPEIAANVAWSSDEAERFEENRLSAIEAIHEFQAWLDDRPELDSTVVVSMAGGTWRAAVRTHTGEEFDPIELKFELLRRIGRYQAAIGRGFAPASLVGEDDVQPLDDAELAGSIERFAKRLAGRAAKMELFPIQLPGFDVEAHTVASAVRPAEIATLVRSDLNTWRLVVERPGDEWIEGAAATRTGQLLDGGCRALAMRYGPTGEPLMAWIGASSLSLTRTWFPNRVLREGFGLYGTHWPVQLGWIDEDDEALRDGIARAQLLEATRLYVAVLLHEETATLEEAAAKLVEYAGLDEETALREAVLSSRDPLRGAAYAVFLQLVAWEDRLAGEMGRKKAVRSVLDAVARQPTSFVGDMKLSEGR